MLSRAAVPNVVPMGTTDKTSEEYKIKESCILKLRL